MLIRTDKSSYDTDLTTQGKIIQKINFLLIKYCYRIHIRNKVK